ncbi:MAG: GNAT family N-acetyltransferase [Proteobacteria bacterium]|nr:GNAT family N-acetyltransferase [Pseudomonadota bacterium]MBU1714210.1 GNAT family N-acetyltransferase [Pseudomonadota bacterium]
MTKSNVKIRPAEPRDIADLTSLLALLFTIEEDFSFDEKRQQRGLALLLKSESCCVLVAEINDQVVGMCTGQLTISTAEGGPALLVEDVVVAKPWRNRGLGRKLLDRLAKWAAKQGACRLQLLADRQNSAALNFYHKLGWQQTQLICLRQRRG